ncbi:hypothetical protein PQ478_09230 [Alkalihalophilus pseudofirmus]|uniref:hypothetical protein n=1 Tax=Alkalihalophilus pseudofirmus TaxID=79885 RepID=UPI00259B50EA|nr:hypothetical protein [Alkalihalophilus pseudofirmus]WEG18651.1 hypothetical protein PQ478_09230 [Alkalihalophilus pseudofirmus]
MNVIELTLADLTAIGLEKLYTDNIKNVSFKMELFTGEIIESTVNTDCHIDSQKSEEC